MAYVSQQRKAELALGIKAVLAKYGMKGSIAVRHHSTLVVTVTSGPLDDRSDEWKRSKTRQSRMNRRSL